MFIKNLIDILQFNMKLFVLRKTKFRFYKRPDLKSPSGLEDDWLNCAHFTKEIAEYKKFLSTKGEKFDFILIDQSNVYEDIKNNFNRALKILEKNGIVVLANSMPKQKRFTSPMVTSDPWLGSVFKFVGELNFNRKVDFHTVDIDNGYTIIMNRKNPVVEERYEITYGLYANMPTSLMRVTDLDGVKKWYEANYIEPKEIKKDVDTHV